MADFAPNFDAEKACEVLLDAAFYADSEAARRHSVSRRTVINYRKRLKTDPAFAQLFTDKLQQLRQDTDWEERLPATLRSALAKMDECFRAMPARSPETLRAISEAVTVMVDALMTLRMLDARLADQDREEAPEDRQVFGASYGLA